MNLSEFRVFLAAAETENFSEAGRQLHLSQPAVSQTIDNLERRYGTELFMRQGRRVCLTEAGQILAPLARELVALTRRMDEAMASLHGELSGEFTIGCSTTLGRYYLPYLISRFRQHFTQVRVHVWVNSRAAVLEKLLSGVFPLGISSKEGVYRDLVYQNFFRDEVVLIVPASHPWILRDRVFPSDLLDEPFLWREEESGTGEVVLAGLQNHGISLDELKVLMVFGSSEAIVTAVEEQMGIAFCSRQAARRAIQLGRVVEVPVAGMPLFRDIYLIRNRRFPLARSQVEFWNYVQSSFTEPDSFQTGGDEA